MSEKLPLWRAVTRLPENVRALSFVSFANDIASESVLPLLPAFVTTVLGLGPAFLGVQEGIAESTASLLKLFAGWRSDRIRKRKIFLILGYGISNVARPLIGLALAGWHVLALRFVDRTGKGLRTSPRDALVAAATGPEQRGLAFGLHRALDSAGAALGQLIATALLLAFAGNLRLVFIVSLVPGVIAMWILIARVRDERLPASPEPLPTSARTDCSSPLAGGLPSGPFRLYLVAVILFTLGNSTDVFLILRAQNLGVPLALVPSLWLVLSLVRAGAALPGGRLSDRIGRRPAILIGWSVYALSYAGFAFAREPWHVWALFALYGLHYGLVEGPERALVGDLVPCEQRGYAYGWFHLCVGMGALPASLLFGLIWQATGAGPAFGFGALMSGLAALMLLIVKAGNRYE